MVFNRKDRRNSARYRNYYHEDYYYEPSMSSNQLTAQNVTTTARLEYERNQHRNEAGSSFVKSYETIVRTAKSTSSSRNNEKKAAGQKRVSDPNLLVCPSRTVRAYLCCCALGCSTHSKCANLRSDKPQYHTLSCSYT